MAVKTKFPYNPDYCIHPGEYLEEVLESRNIKKKDIAERLAVTDKTISLLINGKAYIDPEMAIKLENVLGISANIWNGMSADYRLFEAKAQEQKELSVGIEWLKKFPVKDLIKNGFLEGSNNKEILLKKIYTFFGVSNQKSWEVHYGNVLKSVCCKKTVAFEEDRYHTIAWLRAGEKRAEEIQTSVYNKDRFKSVLDEIRLLTTGRIEETSKRMVELCAESGVALTFVPEFDKTHIWGITRWLSPEKALIVMSLRGKHNDFFWFTFFHEAGHVLLHGKKDIFIDRKETDISYEENEANTFAQEILISRVEYNRFLAAGRFDALSIKRFADKLKVHQAILAGRLVREGKISFVFASRFRDTFEFTVR